MMCLLSWKFFHVLVLIPSIQKWKNLKLNKFRGQCYDGCSTISGHKNGLVIQIKEEEKRAIYTYCYAHPLNLAIGDTMKNSNLFKHTIYDTFELMKLVKYSPKRDAKLNKIKNSLADEKSSESLFGDLLFRCFVQIDTLYVVNVWWCYTKTLTKTRGISSYSKTFSYCCDIRFQLQFFKTVTALKKPCKPQSYQQSMIKEFHIKL